MENIRVVFISIPVKESAEFAREMVKERLAACVNVVPKISSYYWNEDEVKCGEEALLIIKTTQQKIERLVDYVKSNHPYDLPEIITLQVAEGLPDYVNWIIEEVAKA